MFTLVMSKSYTILVPMNPWATVLLLASAVSNAANILVVLPWPYYSHTNNYMPIFRGLAARGHNVTMFSPFPQNPPVPNLTDIVFPNLYKELFGIVHRTNLVQSYGLYYRLFGIWQLSISWINFILQQDAMKELIADTSSKYDLVFVETWFKQEALVAFGHKYNAPVINLGSKFLMPYAAELSGNQLPVSFVPIQNIQYTDRMGLLQRAMNMFQYYWEVTVGNLYYLRVQESLMREHFKYPGSDTLPTLAEMLRNTSLTLAYSNTLAVDYPTPLLKNIVEFGGMHVAFETKKLPKDLQKFMDNAKEGVIYFSFGSNIEYSWATDKLQQSLISVLGKLKQKVLMKLEATNSYINSTKQNILVRQWLPQASILAHPNCKLFITHGGNGGLLEGIYHSVPMLAIPFFADQKLNAKRLERLEIGCKIEPEDVTEENLLLAIKKLLSDSSYKENINRRSAILKDTPTDLLENAIYWVEYVIRHRGAAHLRPAVLDLHWYQYLMLDVIALYLLIMVVIVYVVKTITTLLYNFTSSFKYKLYDLGKSNFKSKQE